MRRRSLSSLTCWKRPSGLTGPPAAVAATRSELSEGIDGEIRLHDCNRAPTLRLRVDPTRRFVHDPSIDVIGKIPELREQPSLELRQGLAIGDPRLPGEIGYIDRNFCATRRT